MATPLYKRLKGNGTENGGGYSTYVFPSVNEDISANYQNDNYDIKFTKFMLLNLDLEKMNLTNPDEFNTESLNTITSKGDLLVNSLRNYVANHEVVVRESKLNQNTYFYDPNQPNTVTERVFWKWLRKSGIIQFEPALPNDEYIESTEFAVDDNAADDYFKEYIWKERTPIKYNIVDIVDEGIQKPHPISLTQMNVYSVKLGSAATIKPNDTINIKNDGTFYIGFTNENFYVDSIASVDEKNDTIYILVPTNIQISFNSISAASLELVYTRVVQYIGEISSHNNVQLANKSYTETMAYIPDQCGQTPDILFRIKADKNYSPGLQYPILPSQDQPEIVGGEIFDNPLVMNPETYPGDQYAYFDLDQKYVNSSGQMDRRRGDFYGVLRNNRKEQRVVEAPYVYPEFDGSKIDGLTVDFNTLHYTKMNLPTKKSNNFDEFNSQSFNNQAPKNFEFNAVLWYYDVEDLTNKTSATNLYGITILNNEVDGKIETYKKFVSNGKEDGLSYQIDLNLNFNINNDNLIESYDPQKVYSMFGFELYNEVMRRVATTNEIFLKLAGHIGVFQNDLNNLKSLIYTTSDVRDINFRIDSVYKLLDIYKNLQIVDSETIKVTKDETTNPPQLKLESKDSRFGLATQLQVSNLYNTQNNTVNDFKITVPSGKDFLINVINDDASNITLDRNSLNIVLDRDLDYRQTCVMNIYPNNSLYNKNLNLSIISSFVANVDKTKGAPLFKKPLNLPIDQNLNPNVKLDGILKRWEYVPERFTPEKVFIKRVSDNYFISLQLNPFITSSFKTGDVLLLENFNILFNGKSYSDIAGQYTVVGEIESNKLNFQIDLISVKNLFTEIDNANGNVSSEYEIKGEYFTQPVCFKINTGYTVTVTRVDRISSSMNEAYMVEVKPFKKLNLE